MHSTLSTWIWLWFHAHFQIYIRNSTKKSYASKISICNLKFINSVNIDSSENASYATTFCKIIPIWMAFIMHAYYCCTRLWFISSFFLIFIPLCAHFFCVQNGLSLLWTLCGRQKWYAKKKTFNEYYLCSFFGITHTIHTKSLLIQTECEKNYGNQQQTHGFYTNVWKTILCISFLAYECN